ncbi:MAG: hypothetical protein BMS9Abin37_1720 [Acidobacteriota bacterium]|nr:MAG: hypothetical protein BMS9Abin37_1720 [Acidobacteriota bacterium]
MALSRGTLLGPYEILAPIGVGGMGEVYKAQDTRLDRIVAIKVLLPHIAEDSTARERFEREAKTVSALNHPHVCTLFDVGLNAPADDATVGGTSRQKVLGEGPGGQMAKRF